MRSWTFGGLAIVLGAGLVIGNPIAARAAKPKTDAVKSLPAGHAAAASSHAATSHGKWVTHVSYKGIPAHSGQFKGGKVSYARYSFSRSSYGGISCVPFARQVTGIDVKGNAANWWDNAAGLYQRGSRPEPGSVLNFRATGHMYLGHVAVVSRVVSGREVEIDHANWPGGGKGGISRGVKVIDVSDNNDWTAVRVALGGGGEYGSVYPTYGFIYDRPDRGTFVANAPVLRAAASYDEVAEAPGGHAYIDAASHTVR
jgi:surface antigen